MHIKENHVFLDGNDYGIGVNKRIPVKGYKIGFMTEEPILNNASRVKHFPLYGVDGDNGVATVTGTGDFSALLAYHEPGDEGLRMVVAFNCTLEEIRDLEMSGDYFEEITCEAKFIMKSGLNKPERIIYSDGGSVCSIDIRSADYTRLHPNIYSDISGYYHYPITRVQGIISEDFDDNTIILAPDWELYEPEEEQFKSDIKGLVNDAVKTAIGTFKVEIQKELNSLKDKLLSGFAK